MSSSVPSKLTAQKICETAMDFAIDKYLEIGEIKNEMLKKFDGDKIKLVQFLRSRESIRNNEDVKVDQEPTTEKKSVSNKQKTPLAKKMVSPKETKTKNTNELF